MKQFLSHCCSSTANFFDLHMILTNYMQALPGLSLLTAEAAYDEYTEMDMPADASFSDGSTSNRLAALQLITQLQVPCHGDSSFHRSSKMPVLVGEYKSLPCHQTSHVF